MATFRIVRSSIGGGLSSLSCDGWLLGWELPQSVGVNQRVVFLLLDTQSLPFVLQGCTLQAQPLGSATTPEI
jgi:hypothetical protein